MRYSIYILVILLAASCLLASVLQPRCLFEYEQRFGDKRPRPDLTPNKASLRSGERLGEGSAKSPGWQPNGICLCDTSGNSLPHIVSDGNSGAIISWSEAYRGWPIDTTRSLRDIYAQRVDSGGNIVWQSQGVPVCSLYATDAAYEKIVSDGKGGAIIAWEEIGRPPDGYSHVWAQRVDSLGNRVWPENGVLVCSQPSGYVDICSDGHGGAIIAWVDGRDEINTSDNIYAQRIDSAGNPVWQVDGVPVCTADSIQFWPYICSNGNSGAILTWKDDYRNNGTTGLDVYAQMLDSSGNVKWTVNGELICNASGAQSARNPTCNSQGGGIIGWNTSGDTNYAYLQNIDSSGNKLWSDVPIKILVMLNEDGRGGGIGSNGNYVQRVDDNGNIRWGLGVPLHETLPSGGENDASEDGYGGVVAIWNYSTHLYAQRVDSSGVVLWNPTGVSVCTTMNTNNYQHVIGDGLGGCIATWYGDTTSPWVWNHVWVQRIYPDGDGVNGNPVQSIEYKISNLKCCPNPYRTRVGICYDLLSDDYVSLDIYNMLGQRVKTLARQKQNKGQHEIKWYGKDDSGKPVSTGIYFITLKYGQYNKSQKIIKLK